MREREKKKTKQRVGIKFQTNTAHHKEKRISFLHDSSQSPLVNFESNFLFNWEK